MNAAADRPVVELCSVTKTFPDGTKAVDDVSLQVMDGETVALLGRSGCGKTTALRLINRLTEPTAGEVRVRGEPVRNHRVEVLRRSIGYVIQEGGLFPHLSVAANVATVPDLLGWPRGRIEQRVEELLDFVGLPAASFAQRKPHELSGGQRQRVGVARALGGDPDLLLMDEPFGAIDPLTRESLHSEFKNLQGQLRKTIILVTHDMVEAGKLADRVVLMDTGRVSQVGTMSDLLFRPANDFVTTFFDAHRQQMTFETLCVDDILDEVDPVGDDADAGKPLQLDGGQVVRLALEMFVKAPPGSHVAVTEGRNAGRVFAVDAVKTRLFDHLVG